MIVINKLLDGVVWVAIRVGLLLWWAVYPFVILLCKFVYRDRRDRVELKEVSGDE